MDTVIINNIIYYKNDLVLNHDSGRLYLVLKGGHFLDIFSQDLVGSRSIATCALFVVGNLTELVEALRSEINTPVNSGIETLTEFNTMASLSKWTTSYWKSPASLADIASSQSWVTSSSNHTGTSIADLLQGTQVKK